MRLVLKGVMAAEDARLAGHPSSGVAGIVVSNHGGRQMDGVLGTAEVLRECVQAVRAVAEETGTEPIQVLVDGGIRRGKDVLRALALGASGVMIGRPALWGLALAGQEGVGRVLGLLRAELAVSMQLCGMPSIAHIDSALVRTRKWPLARL
jgi:isopentenyl diphosphate isomerase/L-lactate dehydrogenase-like FMN-dependent dehydrogenase